MIPHLGLEAFAYSSTEGIIGAPEAGVDLRVWTGQNQSVIAGARTSSRFSIKTASGHGASKGATVWRASGTVAYQWTVHNTVSFHAGVGIEEIRLGEQLATAPLPAAPLIHFDAVSASEFVRSRSYRFTCPPSFSVDAYASWAVDLRRGDFMDRYLGGFTWTF